MELPKTIKIGPYVVAVSDDSERLTIEKISGDSHLAKEHIGINASWVFRYQQDTLLHEVIHLVGDVYSSADKPTENQCEALATGLLQVLHDNPDFTAFILDTSVEEAE